MSGGADETEEEISAEQTAIPVEISPAEPDLCPLQHFDSLPPQLRGNVAAAGYNIPTPVQGWGIPLLMRGRNVMACAQTGSGKTAFYLIPPICAMMQQTPAPVRSTCALVLAPTRELCDQINTEALKLTALTRLSAAVVYGGMEHSESLRQVQNGVHVLAATPERLCDLCAENAISLRSVKWLVLDEPDRMLDMGFESRIRQIVLKRNVPKTRQIVMTGATLTDHVQRLAQDFMSDYSFVAVGKVDGAGSSIQQTLVWVEDWDKQAYLFGLLLPKVEAGLVLVFVNERTQAIYLDSFLTKCGFSVQSLHEDPTQRKTALGKFQTGEATILIATDKEASGLDIPDVALVVQYDMPFQAKAELYVRRLARAGRIGKKGIGISLVNDRNRSLAPSLCKILENLGQAVPRFLEGMALSTDEYTPDTPVVPYAWGQDMRKKGCTKEEPEKSRRFLDFAKRAYGQGVAGSVGPAAPGAYHGAALSRGGMDGLEARLLVDAGPLF